MPTAQINARIDADKKTLGDLALAEIGCAPTRAVRALWDFAGKNRGNTAVLHDMLETLEGASSLNSDCKLESRVRLAESGPSIYSDALAELGIDRAAVSPEDSYDDLLEQAYIDKMAERGTLR